MSIDCKQFKINLIYCWCLRRDRIY